MRDSVIRDAMFRGSPIMSYGTVNRRSMLPKLLALAAGSFVIVVTALYFWLWHVAKFPVPENMTVEVILPAKTKPGINAPTEWNAAIQANDLLPTYAGIAVFKNGKHKPFAIEFSLRNIFTAEFTPWKLKMADGDDARMISDTAYNKLGWLFKENNKVWLRMSFADLFAKSDFTPDLPDKMQGYLENGVWKTDFAVNNQFALLNTDENIYDLNKDANAITLLGQNAGMLENFLAARGWQLRFPEEGKLSWGAATGSLALDYVPDSRLKFSELNGLASGIGIYETRDFELPDKEVVKRLYAPLEFVSSSTKYDLSQGSKGLIIDEWNFLSYNQQDNQIENDTCPGDVLAMFDESSIANICSWTDICYWEINRLLITVENGKMNFCF